MPRGKEPAPGDRFRGFEVRAVTPLDDLRIRAVELRHDATGARLVHLHADDAENLFSITFSTPPRDDTGVPHIMEHSVLCGSKSYPVRSPYFEMRRMSMATFINAMTAADHTLYPVASNVPADLFNLAAVCFDAVFHPLLERETFVTQAHHLQPVDPRDPGGPWTISGIVFNEMKGALSEPERRLFRLELRQLFSETALGKFAAGDPESIPDLTYEAFLEFHRAHYQPANACFVVYGDIDTREYAEFLGPRLAKLERREPALLVPAHPRWSEPRRAIGNYPIASDQEPKGRALLSLSWLVGDANDPATRLRAEILASVLVGQEASPLRRELIEAGLATEVVLAGVQAYGRDLVFRIPVRGADADRADALEACVLHTLERIARDNIDPREFEAALRRAEYQHREIGRMHAVNLMARVISGWVGGTEPLAHLETGPLLEAFRREFRHDPGLVTRWIRERLLDNPHRLTSTLAPEPGGEARAAAAERERMAGIEASLTAAEREHLAAEVERIRSDFAKPNPPDAVARLPQLRLADVPSRPAEIVTVQTAVGEDITLLVNEVFSNGIEYLELDFDLSGLAEELWPFVSRYGDALSKMGTSRRGHTEVARERAFLTGGIDVDVNVTTHASDPSRSVRGLRLSLKSLAAQLPDALDLLRELLFELDPTDRSRLGEVTREAFSRKKARIRQAGSGYAGWLHAARGWTDETRILNLVHGVEQLGLLDRFARAGKSLDDLEFGIAAVRDHLLARPRITASFTGSEDGAGRVRAALQAWHGGMETERPRSAPVAFEPWREGPREGLACAIDVAHSVAVLPAPHLSHPDHVSVKLGSHLIHFDYLLPEIRFKGNAYVAQAAYHRLLSLWSMYSFRDPHLTRTLRVFEGALRYARAARWTERNIEHAAIALAKEEERPIRPESATGLALTRHLTGLTREVRGDLRARLLASKPDPVREATVAFLESALPRASYCSMASRERLEEANQELADKPLLIGELGI